MSSFVEDHNMSVINSGSPVGTNTVILSSKRSLVGITGFLFDHKLKHAQFLIKFDTFLIKNTGVFC